MKQRSGPTSSTAEVPAIEGLRVKVGSLRWTCPKTWISRPGRKPAGPPLLWGQDSAVQALGRLVGPGLGPEASRLLLVTPAGPGWGKACAQFLRERLDSPVRPVELASSVHPTILRGTSETPGLLAQLDGGVLLVEAGDLLEQPEGRRALWEALSHGKVTPLIEPGAPSAPARDARIAAVLLGPEDLLKKLSEEDPRSAAFFPDRLSISSDLPRRKDGVAVLAHRLRAGLEEQGGGRINPDALGWLIEELVGLRGRRGRVPLKLRPATRCLAEARFLQAKGPLELAAVKAAWSDMHQRRAAPEEWAHHRLEEGLLALETRGRARGVTNGLMIYSKDNSSYSMPARISAQVTVGREGVINVERESKFSGRSFDKGVFQLSGFLRARFGIREPLTLAATITLEQSNRRVDGDSATLAETLALLSSLSGLTCRQDLAVSGAINQRGDVLPVGSPSLKVTGWWRVCQLQGLTGHQGVILPRRNIGDLQLPEALVADCAAERFHVWGVQTIEEAIELALGRPAGVTGTAGVYLPGSVFARATRRLARLSQSLRGPSNKGARTKGPASQGGGAGTRKPRQRRPAANKET